MSMQGELVGLVGESGCGKSITARSILNMVRNPGKPMGEVWFYRDGEAINLLDISPDSAEIAAHPR